MVVVRTRMRENIKIVNDFPPNKKKSKGSKENVENIKIVLCCRRERNINSDEGKNKKCVYMCVHIINIYLGLYEKKKCT